MTSAHGRALARAALLGNPSDGYGGAVLAVTLRDFAAEAVTAPAPPDDQPPLVRATIRRFAEHAGIGDPGHVAVTSTIPREVGLAGSSAIVVATLRALCARHAVAFEPDELAALALAVERDDLGIACGPQDRLAQAHEGLLLMDFAAGAPRCESLDPGALPPLYVAYRLDAAQHSGVVHGDLRTRHAAGDRVVIDAMAELGRIARAGRDRLLAADHAGFAALVDATLDVRRSIVDLDPRHARMAELARGAGASANYAGSGGAIVGTFDGPATLRELRRVLEPEGCAVLVPQAR